MQVMDYFSEIQSLIRSSIFVENVDVEYEVKSRSVGIVHGILGLIDGSTLQFMELVNIKRDKIIRLKYRFHLMTVKLWKASETAHTNLEEFRDVLSRRGIKIKVSGRKEESGKRLKEVFGHTKYCQGRIVSGSLHLYIIVINWSICEL